MAFHLQLRRMYERLQSGEVTFCSSEDVKCKGRFFRRKSENDGVMFYIYNSLLPSI